MNHFDKLLKLFKKNKQPCAVSLKNLNGHLSSKLQNYHEMFLKNPYIHRGVLLIANNIANYDFVLENHDPILHKLFTTPNSNESWHSFIEKIISNYLIFGNVFIYLNKNSNNDYYMHVINNKNINVELNDENETVYSYFNNKDKIIFDNKSLPYVFHLKNYSPVDDIYGVSLLDSIQVSSTLYHDIDVNNLSILNNGGRSAGILALKNRANKFTEEDTTSLVENFVNRYQGADKAGNVTIVNADVEWIHTGYSSKDMDYASSSKRAIKAIASALGIPSILIGESMEGDSSRANMDYIIQSFENYTITPILRKLFEFLNNIIYKLNFENKIIPKLNKVNNNE